MQVSEDDWSFDVPVDIPPHGDPPFLCLRSFCREPAYDEVSTLEISLSDSPDQTFFARVSLEHLVFDLGQTAQAWTLDHAGSGQGGPAPGLRSGVARGQRQTEHQAEDVTGTGGT